MATDTKQVDVELGTGNGATAGAGAGAGAASTQAYVDSDSDSELEREVEEEAAEEEIEDLTRSGNLDAAAKREAERKKKEKEKAKSKKLAPMSILFTYADGVDYMLYFIGAIAAIAGGVLMPMFSIIFGELLDSFTTFGSQDDIMPQIRKFAGYISLLGVGAWIVSYLEVACFTIAGERQTKRIREQYVASLLKMDVSWFDKRNSHKLVTKVANETQAIHDGIGDKLGLGLRFTITFIAGFIVGFFNGWQLTLLMCLMAPLMAIAGGMMMSFMASAERRGQAVYAKAGAVAQERLSAIRTVQACGREDDALDIYKKHLLVANKMGVKKNCFQGLSMGFTFLIMFCTYGLAFWFGSKLIADDRQEVLDQVPAGCPPALDYATICTADWLQGAPAACATWCNPTVMDCVFGETCHTGGDVVLVFFSVIIGAMAIGQATPSMTAVATARVGAHKVFKVINHRINIDVTADDKKDVAKDGGDVDFKNVTFYYPSKPTVRVLDNFTLHVPQGKTVALVGPSGCGKSTVVSLLQRFYDPVRGSVTIGDSDVREVNVRSLRGAMGLVSQEPVLFGTTIKENIQLGTSTTVTDDEVKAAAQQANAHDFIMTLEDQYDTMVGQAGKSLSGGQKQRIAIARALIRNPHILLLDEATSALDSQSEATVQAALNKIMDSGGRTTIVIAHRLSTIKSADIIVGIDKGRVVEQGSHDELMQNPEGLYRRMVEAQESGRDGALGALAAAPEDDDSAEEETGAGAGAGAGALLQVNVEAGGRTRSRSNSGAGRERTRSRSRSKSVLDMGSAETPEGVDTSLSRLMGESKPECGWVILGVIGAAFQGSVFPLFSIAFTEMVTLFYEPNIETMRDSGAFWGVMFVILAILAALAGVSMIGSFGVVGERLTMRLRIRAFRAALYKDMAYLDRKENGTGALTTRLAQDATMVNAVAAGLAGLVAQNIVTIVVGLVIAFESDWRLTLVVLACAPIIAAGGYIQMKVFTGQSNSAKASLENAGYIVGESVHGIRTVAAFDLSTRIHRLYASKLVEPARLGKRGGHIAGLGFGFSQFSMMAVYGLSFFVGGLWVADGSLDFGQLMRVLMSVMMTAVALGQSNSFAPDMAKAKAAVSAIFSLVDIKPPIDSEGNTGVIPSNFKGDIVLSHVDFRYPTRRGRVLRDFNLHIKAGQTVALVGPSGSGKSTIVQLLQRFYDPLKGSGGITIDGTPLQDINVRWLRSKIGVVSQEPTLFQGTIKDNIAYGKVRGETITDDEIEFAAKQAFAHDFIRERNKGYNSVVKSDTLSGGQKQRIAIARAIIRDPPILLLDEATSALDNESEKIVQAALDKATEGNRTTIVIAHRLSTIKDADVIVVMKEGEIVEQGTHEQLTAVEGGIYADMWQKQQLVDAGKRLDKH